MADEVDDYLSWLARPVPAEGRDTRLLACVDVATARRLLSSGGGVEMRSLAAAAGVESAGPRDALIEAILGVDPPLEMVFRHIVIDARNALNLLALLPDMEAGEADATFAAMRDELLWRVFWRRLAGHLAGAGRSGDGH